MQLVDLPGYRRTKFSSVFIIGLTMVASSACSHEPAATTSSPTATDQQAQETTPSLAYEVIAPGGAGHFTAVGVHPVNSDIRFFGTDVGGIFRTLDGGANFERIGFGLTTKRIFSFSVVRTGQMDLVFAATSDGIYRSADLGTTWALKENGILEPVSAEFFTKPMQHVVATSSGIVWAVGGESHGPKGGVVERATVYRSTDFGESWTPRLLIQDEAGAGPLKARLALLEANNGRGPVAIASNYGFYVSYDEGSSWYELGRPRARVSWNQDGVATVAGIEWQDCTGQCVGDLNRPLCEDGDDCLPLTTQVEVKHPTLQDIVVTHGEGDQPPVITVVADYLGYTHDSVACNVDSYWNDVGFTQLTAGPYQSRDGGRSWQYLFTGNNDARAVGKAIRCGSSKPLSWESTGYRGLAVNPNDPSHVFVSAIWIDGGIYERVLDGQGRGIWRTTANDTFEGNLRQGLWGPQQGPGVTTMKALSWTPRVELLATHSRGVLHGVQASNLSRAFTFDHITQDPIWDPESDPVAVNWKTRKMDDYCALDMAWGPKGLGAYDESKLFLGGEDSGVVRSVDDGQTWFRTVGGLSNDDATSAIVSDPEAGTASATLYASRYESSEKNRCSVQRSDDGGLNWTTIGGYSGGATTTGGLDEWSRVVDLALDYASSPRARRLYASVVDDNAGRSPRVHGLYRYDPTATPPWVSLKSQYSNCPLGTIVHRVHSFPDHRDKVLFATYQAGNARGQNNRSVADAGIWLFEEGVGCRRLSEEAIRAGFDVAVVEDPSEPTGLALLAIAVDYGYPAIFRSAFSWDVPFVYNWTRTVLTQLPRAGDLNSAIRKSFSAVAVDPTDRTRVLVGVGGTLHFDHYAHTVIYKTEDSGQTWTVAEELSTLPDKDIEFLRFSPAGDRLYVAPRCGSLWRMPNPFLPSTGGARSLVGDP